MEYYVYEWFIQDTNKVFYVGKGKGNRAFNTKKSRNNYFINVINKYNCDVRIVKYFLLKEEADNYEKELISYYKNIGQCYTNFNMGGEGGDTISQLPESQKQIIKNKESIIQSQIKKEMYKDKTKHPLYGKFGNDNPNYGKQRDDETKDKISQSLKWREFTKEHRENIGKANKGKIISENQKNTVSQKLKGELNGRSLKIEIFLNDKNIGFNCKKDALLYLQSIGITINTNNQFKGTLIKRGTFDKLLSTGEIYTDTNNNTLKILKK